MRRLVVLSRKAYFDLDQEIEAFRSNSDEYTNFTEEECEELAWRRIFYLASKEMNCQENQMDWEVIEQQTT